MNTPTQTRAQPVAAHTLFTLPPRSSNEGWSICADAGGGAIRRVAQNLKPEEAEQIVRSFNSHSALVESLDSLLRATDKMRDEPSEANDFEWGCCVEDARRVIAADKVR